MSNMSNEKRFFLCMLLTFAWMMGWPYVARQMGWAPEPKKPQAAVVAGKDQEKKGELAAASKDADKAKAETAKPEVAAKKAESPAVPAAPKKPVATRSAAILSCRRSSSPTPTSIAG